MSIALERNNSGGDRRIDRPGVAHLNMACGSSIYNSSEFSTPDQRFPAPQKLMPEYESGTDSASSTSSIGKNSDDSTGGGGGEDEEEVQSEYKGGPLDSLDSLEEVLPIKKSISRFYSGKSKSFTSLSDAACSSMEEITKPENAYTRKRKNLLAFNNFLEKNHSNILRSSITKRPTNSKSMLTLAAAINCSETNSGEASKSSSPSTGCSLPPLPPHARRPIHCELSSLPSADKFSPRRSFSLFDLQGADAAEAQVSSLLDHGPITE